MNLQDCDNPRVVKSSKRIEGVQDGWRWRVGVYRILGIIKDDIVTIKVFKIGHRRDVYRGI